jgi:adenylate cyclase
MRLPISIKLVIITVSLLSAVTITVAIMASQHFQKTAKQREETINVDFSIAKGSLLQSDVDKAINRSVSLGSEVYRFIRKSEESEYTKAQELVMRDSTVLCFHLLNSTGLTVWKSSVSDEKFQNNWPDVSQKGVAIVAASDNQVYIEPVRLSDEFSFLRFYVPLVKDQSGKVSYIVVIDYDIKIIHGLFKESSERTYFVVDSENRVLYHSEGLNYIRTNLDNHPTILLARRADSPSKGQKLILDPILKEKVYSAFFKTHHNFILVSQISEALILEPAIAVKRRIFLIGGIVLSISILMVFWFSLTLSSPIEKLASLMELVKKGIFDIQAFQKTKSFFSDEVSDLALAVDQMAEGLKERDKVKNLFSKFVGSSVTDDLLNREVSLGGTRKEVVVFFSDIRGFTAMSEVLDPEDVVEMLNEYFKIMVKIINETGGVVDKFIGDAIMAIWGVPNPKSDDPIYAIRACLRMREALNVFNEKRTAAGKDPLMIGMGLNMGPAVAGTIGSDERMEYTVIGNTVNTSSRIEASTKAFGTDLLVSEEIFERCKTQFIFDLAGEVEVKGRSQALKLYKVRGYLDESGREIIVSTPYSEYQAESADKVKLKTDLS